MKINTKSVEKEIKENNWTQGQTSMEISDDENMCQPAQRGLGK